jgi:hypothetical protein
VRDRLSAPSGSGDDGTENGKTPDVTDRRSATAVSRVGRRLGFYPGAPRRNVLIAFGYLLVILALIWLAGLG